MLSLQHRSLPVMALAEHSELFALLCLININVNVNTRHNPTVGQAVSYRFEHIAPNWQQIRDHA